VQQHELVDAQQPQQPPLVAREGRHGGGRIDQLWLEQGVIAAAPGDHGPPAARMLWYQAECSPKVRGITNPSPNGRIPSGVA
jgi:hypothetical protein